MAEHSFDTLVPAPRSALPAAERAAGGDLPPSAPAPAPEPAPAAVAAPGAAPEPGMPRFVEGRGKPRSMVIDLLYPIEFGGRVYDAITLRRPNAAEVGRYFEQLVDLMATDPGASLPFPIFVDADGAAIPQAVLDFLDGEDDENVMRASADFLPPRLRRLLAASQPASTPASGATTAP